MKNKLKSCTWMHRDQLMQNVTGIKLRIIITKPANRMFEKLVIQEVYQRHTDRAL